MLWIFEFFLKFKFLKQKKFVNECEFDFNIFYHFIVVVDYFKDIIFCWNKFCRRKFFFSFDFFFFNFQKKKFYRLSNCFSFFSNSRLLFERIDTLFFSNCKYNSQQFRKHQSQSIEYSLAQKNKPSYLIRKQTKFRSIDSHFSKNAAKILRFLTYFCRFWIMIRHLHKCVHCLSMFVIFCNFFFNDLTFRKKNNHHVFFAHFFRFARKKCC